MNLVHNDIKLDNILIGKRQTDTLYLIDFGLTQSYMDDKTNKHTVKTYTKKFTGNYLFASLNSCRGYNKSRRDDIESLFYLLIFMLNREKLPWACLNI